MQKSQRRPETDELLKQVEILFSRTKVKLWSEGKKEVISLDLTDDLAKAITFGRRCGHLKGGLESIEKVLRLEESGLLALQNRGISNNERISRLILIADDGSERFFRACESLLFKHQGRLAGIRLKVNGSEFGRRFFGRDAMVKLALVNQKASVERILLACLKETEHNAEPIATAESER